MLNRRIFMYLLLVVAFAIPARAQEDETEGDDLFSKTIDSAMAISPLYLPTSYTQCGEIFFQPVEYKDIDTTMNTIGQFDPLMATENIYQDLGIHGQAHRPVNFQFSQRPGFQLITNPYPLYFKEQSDLRMYKLKTSYTNIAYSYGISAENHFYATHAQNVKDKVNFAVNLRGYRNNGYFTHQMCNGISFDALLHYEIPSEIYGFKASYIINNGAFEENGGLLNMRDFIDHTSKDLEGYNMKLYSATSKMLTHDLMFQQYVNIKTKSKAKEKDRYWGTLIHTFQFKQQRMTYADATPDSTYYGFSSAPSDSTIDTLKFYKIANTLQFSTFQPYKENKSEKHFLHFTGGITYEYTNYRMRNYYGHSLIPFAQAHLRLFTLMDLHAKIHYVLGGYNRNDLNASATLCWRLGKNSNHRVSADIDFYYLSPDYILSDFADNHHFWTNRWAKKQNIVRVTPAWQWKEYKVEFSYFMLHNYVYLDQSLSPQLFDRFASILQLHLYAPFYLKGFGLKGNFYLQYADQEIIQVPVFAGKLDFFYRFNIFKGKAKLQFGFDAAYNTSYYGYGYYPLLRQFYQQTEVKTGNYLYWDLYAAVQVQRINIFFRVGHVLSGVIGNRYFSTPDYPSQGRSFELGIKWRFFD